MEGSHGPSRPDRKTVERNRRIHMKSLHSRLEALLPTSLNSREGVSLPLPGRLDDAVRYIESLKGKMEKMKNRKRQLMGSEGTSQGMSRETAGGVRVSHVEVQDLGHELQVALVSSPSDRFVFYDIVCAMEEEGAEILSANLSVVGDEAFHTIHSLATDTGSGLEAGKVLERLKNAIHAV